CDRVLEALDAHGAIRADVPGRRDLSVIDREPPRGGIRAARPVFEPGLVTEQEGWPRRCLRRGRNTSTRLLEIFCYSLRDGRVGIPDQSRASAAVHRA